MNLFDYPTKLSEEFFTVLAENKNIRIERIVSAGQTSDWYDQEETEFVLLVSGKAVLEYENKYQVELNEGDTIIIKPHERHRVIYTSSEPACVWLCVFY